MIISLRNFCVLDTEFSVRRNCVTVICLGVKLVVAQTVLLAVCQVLRDISCVNPSRTPKAFKGKGSAVSQSVKSGMTDNCSVLVGAGA